MVWVLVTTSSLIFHIIWNSISRRYSLPLFTKDYNYRLTLEERHLQSNLTLTNLIHDVLVSILSTWIILSHQHWKSTNMQSLPPNSQDISILISITLGYMIAEQYNILTSVLTNPKKYQHVCRSEMPWYLFHLVIFCALCVCLYTESGYIPVVWGIWGEIYAVFCNLQDLGYIQGEALSSALCISFLALLIFVLNRMLPLLWILYLALFHSTSSDILWSDPFQLSITYIVQLILLIVITLFNLQFAFEQIKGLTMLMEMLFQKKK